MPLVLLGAGILVAIRIPAAAPWLLLLAFPFSLFAAAAGHTEDVERHAFTPLALAIAVLSLGLFGASAAWASALPVSLRPSSSRHLVQPSPPSGRSPASPRLRLLVMALAVPGALLIAVLAPGWGGSTLERNWGDAARQGAVFTAAVAATLAIVTVAVFVGPALRADYRRVPLSRSARRVRVTVMLLLALLGAATYLVIR